MKLKTAPFGLIFLTACSFTNVTWTEGTWEVSSLDAADGEDECGIVPVLSGLDAISYTFGPEIPGDSVIDIANNGLLEGDALTSAQANLWNLCDSPDPYFYCDDAIEQIHAEQWLTAVIATLAESQCNAGEWKASYSSSDGLLLSKNEALVNSHIRLECDVSSTTSCNSRFTTRLRPQN